MPRHLILRKYPWIYAAVHKIVEKIFVGNSSRQIQRLWDPLSRVCSTIMIRKLILRSIVKMMPSNFQCLFLWCCWNYLNDLGAFAKFSVIVYCVCKLFTCTLPGWSSVCKYGIYMGLKRANLCTYLTMPHSKCALNVGFNNICWAR